MTDAAPRIVITGFMAAGKTTVARALAARLNCAWLDLDEVVNARTRRTAATLIEAAGEARFRELETEALRAALATDARILALGGGTWTVARNRELIARAGCTTVWLDAPFALCWQRITAGTDAARPLAPDLTAARALYAERRAHYRLAAHRVHVGATESAADVAEVIAARLTQARLPGETN